MKSRVPLFAVCWIVVGLGHCRSAVAADVPVQFANGIFYSRHDASGDGVWFTPADGSAETPITAGGRARLSPDGSALSFLRGDLVNGLGSIWVRDLSSDVEQQIFSQSSQRIVGLAWSLDGSRVIFDYTNGTYSVQRDGFGFTNLVSGDANDDAPSVRLCDGALAFFNTNSGLISTDANGQGRLPVPNTQPGEIWPVWSGDGQWLLFTDLHDLWKIRSDGSGRTRLTYLTNFNDFFSGPPGWSLDGRLVIACGKVDGQTGLFAVDPGGQGGIALLRVFPSESQVMDVGAVTGIPVSHSSLTTGITHRLSGAPLEVQVFGTPGTRYFLEASPNLQTWVVLETNIVSKFSFGYTLVGTNSPYQFFRATAIPGVNVTQHHNHESRHGLYIDPAFTRVAAANLTRDGNFNGTIAGNVYAQPLYIENGPGGKAMVIAVTESNNVYALDATLGTIIWQTNVGAPVALTNMPCGNIDPLGITGTPIVDLPSRALFLDAMTTPDNGTTKRHLIFSINVDTGIINPGWPVDVNAAARFGGATFTSETQSQRGALALAGGRVYVAYGGHYGDCSTYHGWLVGVPIDYPGCVAAWATAARGGGAWGVGGVACDGAAPFLVTGNTSGTASWGGGEAVLRFHTGTVFTNVANFWAPTNWLTLDNDDFDLGGCAALLVDVPGSTPSKLVVALGKDGNAYLLDRANLGGISKPLAQAQVSTISMINAAATYRTARGTYVAFRGFTVGCTNIGDIGAFIINPGNPPTISMAWCAYGSGRGSPFVTSTDGTNNVIVWAVGAQGDQRLHGFDGDTGAVIFAGGGGPELMADTRRPNTGIVARGRIFFAADNKVYAFTVPPPIVLTQPTKLPGAAFTFGFTNAAGLSFSVLASTNPASPLTGWSGLGKATEIAPGQFQFTDSQASNSARKFYRVRLP